MRILFVSNYFTPEVNAPANRLADHARIWVDDGHDIEILTAVPNFPEGSVYPGYHNRLTTEQRNGVRVVRVPMYMAPNRGTVRRTLSFLSFMVSAAWHRRALADPPDVVVATSPQFFAGLAGLRIARALSVPFVLEIRDLWPDSIVAVGALRDSPLIRLLRRLEGFIYRKADHIVVVTDSFLEELQGKGVPKHKISVVKNGVRTSALPKQEEGARLATRNQLDLSDRFVASYVGTLGMAHRADVLLDAAEIAASSEVEGDDRMAFLLVGDGSERAAIEARIKRGNPENVILLPKQPRDRALALVAASDVSVVHLRASELFRTVIPSKMFEAMALGVPIALGVEGEAKEIVAASGAGDPFQPEDPEALLRLLRRLRTDQALYAARAQAGPPFVKRYFDRKVLARRYARILESAAAVSQGSAAEAGR